MNRANRPRMSRISGSSYDSRLMSRSGDGSTLSLDFTTMGGVLDPRLTFSRASTATFVNSQGYVDHAGANLLLQGSNLGNATNWFGNGLTSRNASTDPNGLNEAVELNEDATNTVHAVIQVISQNLNGLVYTSSVYMKAGTNRTIGFIRDNNVSSDAVVFYTLTGSGSTNIANGSYGISASISSVGAGWYRCVFTIKAISTANVTIGTAKGTAYGDWSFAGTVGNSIYVWGAQLNPGSTAQTYYPTTTAAYHAPRFDYSPTNIGEPRGLLVEGQTQNLTTYSEDFANINWQKDNSGGSAPVVTIVSAATPANGASVNQIVFNKTGGAFSRIQRTSVGTTSAPYTMSVWMRTVTGTANVGLRIGSDILGFNCAVTTTWTRFQYTFTLIDTNSSAQIMLWDNIIGNDEIATVYVWGCQVEAGSSASSYIPTGASQATRNADKMSMADISTMQWNQTAGTFSLHMNVSAETNTSSFPTFMGMYTATPVRVVRFLLNNSSGTTPRIGNDTWTATPSQIVSNIGNTRPFAPNAFKYAVSLSNTGQTLNQVVNAGSVVTTSGTGTMQTPTRLLWNQDPSALDTEYFPIHMRSLKYWPTDLSNAQLQSITT